MHLAVRSLFGVVLAGLLTGCASTQGGSGNLQARVIQLERTVSQQEQTIDELRQRASMSSGRSTKSSSSGKSSVLADRGIIRVPAAPQEVQTALQGAGYYSGNIDGKIGGQTIEAIKQFQRDNNLKVDGIVGAGTWSQLKSASTSAAASTAGADTTAAE